MYSDQIQEITVDLLLGRKETEGASTWAGHGEGSGMEGRAGQEAGAGGRQCSSGPLGSRCSCPSLSGLSGAACPATGMSRGRLRGQGRVGLAAGLGLLLGQSAVPSRQQRGCCRGEKAPRLWSAPPTVPSTAVVSTTQVRPWALPPAHGETKGLRRSQRSLYSGADAPHARGACIASSLLGPSCGCRSLLLSPELRRLHTRFLLLSGTWL